MSKIEWTDATWNPVVGCSIVSPGCTHCYAMRHAWRLMHNPKTAARYRGTAKLVKGRPIWTGRLSFGAGLQVLAPLHWRRPRRVFVNSMSDLFHEDVPDEWIDRVFTVMALCPQHRFQVLTKRAKRMREYMTRLHDEPVSATLKRLVAFWPPKIPAPRDGIEIPLPNVWLGVSVEDQARADERIPDLLETPAAVRFVSFEPLLGPIDLHAATRAGARAHPTSALDWAIVGGESGPRARPMHPDWARGLRDQCVDAGVAFFFKQWGESRPGSDFMNRPGHAFCMDRAGRVVDAPARHADFPAGAESADGWTWMRRIGKKRAGRLLDGREWNEYPEAAA